MTETILSYNELFVKRDYVTGRKGFNPLNKEKLTPLELDEIFNDWMYGG